MPSLSPTQVKDIVFSRGYDVMADEYSTSDEVWRKFVPSNRILAPDDERITDRPYGHRFVDPVGGEDLERVDDGQVIPVETRIQGYKRQVAIVPLGKGLRFSERLLRTPEAQRRVVADIIAWAPKQAKAASRYRNTKIANMFLNGTLSAGHAATFDQSYPGEPDANLGFIYDGKPWFAASGNAHPFKGHTATGGQGVNLTVSSTLSGANLDAAYIRMSVTNAIDEMGNDAEGSAVCTPKYLLVGPDLRTDALQLLNSEHLPGSTTNDVNPNRGLVEPIVWSKLTATGAWWLLAEDPGLLVVDSGMPTLTTRVDEATREVVVESFMEFGACPFNWRGADCNNKGTS